MKKRRGKQAEFVRWMGPLLDALRELGGSGTPKQVEEIIVRNVGVSDATRNATTKGGKPRFPNQVAFARQYLIWEGLVDAPEHGVWALSEQGRNASLSEEESRAIFLKWVKHHAEARKRRAEKKSQQATSLDDDKLAEIGELFEEFANSYLNTEAGEQHICWYPMLRQDAQRNYCEVVAADDRGEDVTNLVLLKLLPHSDTKHNRESGAWVTVAPSITGDLKLWFERAGWAKHDDWPEIARRILKFVRRCLDDPRQLSDACQEFADSQYSKGFQSGMLSPILNALNPDEFMLINNKSRRLVNFIARTKSKLSLADYPAANAVGRQIVDTLADVLILPDVPETRPDDLFDMFSHWLVSIKKYEFGGVRYWKIAPGKNAWNWDACREGGFLAIGWDKLGDLSGIDKKEFDKRAKPLLAEHRDWTQEGIKQAWKFSQIREGDRVVANRGTTEILGIGTVTGPYEYVQTDRHCHRLPVEWDDLTRRKINEQGWRRTLIRLRPDKFEAICKAPEIDDRGPSVTPPPVNPEYSLAACAEETGIELQTLEHWINSVERKLQAVLYGPPGTDKTFVARCLAKHLVSQTDGFVELVQFHPAYAYEDFIQGIRPVARTDGALDYRVVAGRFLDFCGRAVHCTGRCVLIVDEINRANLSRVFGELMYLLEYRDEEVPLAAGGTLRIPENVRVLGTMNTADRSIALVDHALRRRFAFLPLYPNYNVLRNYHETNGFNAEPLIQLLQRLNLQIGDKHYEVGISFFLRMDLEQQLEDIWRTEIEPYLEEFFFDQEAKVDEFRWERIGERLLP